jgi:teichuronic acid biosynthesis glycosyltransferase TuaC
MPRIAVVTPLFPIREEPYRGHAIYQTVLHLQRHAEVEVISPVAVYPPPLVPRYRYHRVDASYRPPGVSTRYVEYPAIPMLTRPLNGVICARRIESHLRQINPDLILNYWLYPEGYAAVRAARRLGKPVIVASRGSDLRRIGDPITRHLVRSTVNSANFVLTVSEDLRRRVIAMGVPPERSRSIPNGCSHTVFQYSDAAGARARLGIAPEEKVILFVGWLAPTKGLSELLTAFRGMAAADPSLRLVCIGEGSYLPEIHAFVHAAGLEKRVILPGPCPPETVAAWMNAADVFCLPSYSEGCPNVVVESIACGCPVVGTKVGGIPELLSDNCGIMVEPRNSGALQGALSEALSRTWDRPGISGTSARSWQKVADETFEVCRELIIPKKLKVTVVTPYFPISAEPYRGHSAYQTLRAMKDKAEIEVLCPVATYPPLRWLNPRGYRYHRPDLSYSPPDLKATYFTYPALPVISRPVNGFICRRYLKSYLKASRPDVILNYWLYPEGYSAMRVGRELGIPVIVGSIGSDLRRIGDPITRHFVKETVRRADAVLTVSEELRSRAIALGADAGRVFTVVNGCDRSIFHPADRRAARRELGVPQDRELLLFIGWLSPTKGIVELLLAMRELGQSRPNLCLALIGEGAYRPIAEQYAAVEKFSDRLLFLGRLPSLEVARWITACDVFCLPSHSEGCPNVVIEAIASGRPVVATSVGGIPDLVDEGCGILVPPNDPAKLQSAIEMALDRSWDEAAISAHFGRGWKTVAEETWEVCRKVVRGG